MIDKDTLFLSLGYHPRITCRAIHHAEMDMGVPYRYVREYMHPVVRGSKTRREPFYMYVWYYGCNIKKNYNTKIWPRFRSAYKVKKASLGRGEIYSYSMREFYECALDLFRDDLYILLKEIPKKKPYKRKM
jgi:aminoglycoside 3-N-acetyltransferase